MTKDARDILIDCCVEFISLVSSEANDIMERESKKTISPEHVGDALKELGFPEYVQEVLATAGDQKEQLKSREKKTSKMDQSGLSQEELEAKQRELFQMATDKYNQGPAE
ncbi:MAG: hypothetical protein HETSPECPRED_005462 [Heterodermia speciosa]|uniref:NCT transcriptional regulatory complex subunit B n=1 Tax=Heterodermia speciosa TaxID=116794 RepID=A0A8H3IQS8_9LECA|nr:MAG: hypothetical protein HETSPECPRED_005462 [Heterodermia speciosa]